MHIANRNKLKHLQLSFNAIHFAASIFHIQHIYICICLYRICVWANIYLFFIFFAIFLHYVLYVLTLISNFYTKCFVGFFPNDHCFVFFYFVLEMKSTDDRSPMLPKTTYKYPNWMHGHTRSLINFEHFSLA